VIVSCMALAKSAIVYSPAYSALEWASASCRPLIRISWSLDLALGLKLHRCPSMAIVRRYC